MIAIPHGSWPRLVASFLLCSSSAALASTEDNCEIPAGIEETVDKLAATTTGCDREAECLKRADGEWQALLAKYPQSIPLHRRYQGVWTSIDRDKVMREYKQMLDAHPDDAYALTLYARALHGGDRKDERVALLTKALELDPKYAWAHFSFAWLYAGRIDEKDKDIEKAKPHVLAFVEACPNSLLVSGLARSMNDRTLEARVLELARGGIDSLPPEQALRRYAASWEGAFRIASPAEHAAVRERVRADVERVRAMKLEGLHVWWTALEQGYKLTGDKPAQITAQEEIAHRFPCEADALRFADQAWGRSNPRPEGRMSTEAWTKRNENRYQFARGLAERCPASTHAGSLHYSAARDHTGVPRKELATWCGPCKGELPYMQKLYDRIKDRTDLAIVTLNVDDSVGLVEPFMTENKYTFPVVFAEAFWSKLDVEKAIPTNWVVDDGGKVRLEHLGFDESAGDRWVDNVLAQLDTKAAATAAAN